jgi:5,10-methylenetetrahydromethanopterin reductase
MTAEARSATGESVGIGFLGHPAIHEMAALAQLAEASGFESAWVSETRITRDAVSGMAAILGTTDRLRVGSAAINLFTRGAALVASTWASLAEAAPGRVVLGLGIGSPSTLAQQGHTVDHAIGRLGEFVEAVRAAWTAPAPVDYNGRYVRFQRLDVEVRPPIVPPIYLCVGGPQALATAGRVADGVVFDVFLPPSAVSRAGGRVNAAASGRFAGEIAAALVVSIAETTREAVARLRPRLASYLVRFPELAREIGVDPELLARIAERAATGGIEATYGDIGDSLIARCSVSGPVAVCRERIAEYRDAGVTLPILFPEPGSSRRVVSELGPVAAGGPR